MTNEEWFDAEIAPALLTLAKRCEERGVSFLNIAEYDPTDGRTTRTMVLAPGHSLGMKVVELSMRTKDNVDGLIMGLMRYARAHGHSSACLKTLGVPTSPEVSTTPV
jgi:hypothetical protein